MASFKKDAIDGLSSCCNPLRRAIQSRSEAGFGRFMVKSKDVKPLSQLSIGLVYKAKFAEI